MHSTNNNNSSSSYKIVVLLLLLNCEIFKLSFAQTDLFETPPENAVQIKYADDQPNSNNTVMDTRQQDESTMDWFATSVTPDIIKKRPLKSSFKKHDPYYGKHLCGNGQYSCVTIKRGDTWQSLFPDKYQRELVQRINRTNRGLWNRTWILVPNNINQSYMNFSPLNKNITTDGKKTVVIDLSELAFGAYDQDGNLVHWGPVNPGKSGSGTVRGGNFKVIRKGGPNCWSKKFEAKIPYCIFFHNGYAMHGFAMPGYPASHGCVRMYNDDALWLNQSFTDYKTKVIVRP